MALLGRLDLVNDHLHRPNEVNPYQRRRTLFAMELMKMSSIALFDQPLRDFPRYDRHYFDEILDQLRSDPSRGIVIATQNKEFIRQWADSILVLKDGRVEALCDQSGLDQAIS